MAVMTDVREAAQGLIEYAIHRSMIGQDDRIWAYNTILECIGATGPALDMAWALKTEKISLLHPDTLPDFDLEGTLAALAEYLDTPVEQVARATRNTTREVYGI